MDNTDAPNVLEVISSMRVENDLCDSNELKKGFDISTDKARYRVQQSYGSVLMITLKF